MPAITTTIQLNDKFTKVIQGIDKAVNQTVATMEELNRKMGSPVGTKTFDALRQNLAESGSGLKQLTEEQEKYNKKLTQGKAQADGLFGSIKKLVAAYGTMQTARQAINLSDTMTSTQARLSLIVDDGGSVDLLQNKIMAAAEASRSSYQDVADSVAKLGMTAGDAFSGTDEIIKFTELMNKNFTISGASVQEASSAMYQLTQAMQSGRLQGDEYRSIIENAPLLAESIEDYMRNVQGATGTMKEWASEGLLTADVIKNALFSAADETETRFEQMPMTFAQIWTSFQNNALMAFQPVLTRLNQIANSEAFQTFVDNAINAMAQVANVVIGIFEQIGSLAQFISDNWSVIEPLVMGAVVALGIYYGSILLARAATMMHTVALGLQAAATFIATAAQQGLNAALASCPLVWIIIMIVAIIAVIFAVAQAIANVVDGVDSALGVIIGALATAAAFIGNLFVALVNFAIDIFVTLYNTVAQIANAFATIFVNPLGAAAQLFQSFADVVLSIVEAIASALDTLFGTGLADAVSGFRGQLRDWAANVGNGQTAEVMKVIDAQDYHLDRFEYGEAWNAGTNLGDSISAGISDKIDSLFGGDSVTDWASEYGLNTQDIANGAASGIGDSGLGDSASDAAGSAAKAADALSASEEDLKYLRDIAEQEAINRFTTAAITVDMSGMQNTVNSGLDLDGIISQMTDAVNEAVETMAEGVYA